MCELGVASAAGTNCLSGDKARAKAWYQRAVELHHIEPWQTNYGGFLLKGAWLERVQRLG